MPTLKALNFRPLPVTSDYWDVDTLLKHCLEHFTESLLKDFVFTGSSAWDPKWDRLEHLILRNANEVTYREQDQLFRISLPRKKFRALFKIYLPYVSTEELHSDYYIDGKEMPLEDYKELIKNFNEQYEKEQLCGAWWPELNMYIIQVLDKNYYFYTITRNFSETMYQDS